MRRSAVGVTLTLLVMALSGCNSGSELTSNAISKDTKAVPSTAAPAPEAFPSPAVDVAIAPVPVALTRPTDPDERVRVIKSGRADPFKPLVSAARSPSRPGTRLSAPSRSAPSRSIPSRGTPKISFSPSRSNPRLPKVSAPAPKVSPSGPSKAVLPPLPAPEPTVAKGVKVQGIVVVAGRPQAIVQAPDEKTARTISAGDRIANGQVLLKGFDMSNSIAPKAIFQEAGMEVAIGVGQDPIVLASASSRQPAIRGLYKVMPKQ